MSFENLTNLYEVIKTLKFELKPSKSTAQRIKWDIQHVRNKDIKDQNDQYQYHKQFFADIENIVDKQRSILFLLQNTGFSEIIIYKDLIKLLDRDLYQKLKTGKLSKENTLSVFLKTNPDFEVVFHDAVVQKYKILSEKFHKYHSYFEDIGKVYRKSDKDYAQKQLCLAIIKAHEFLGYFVYKTGKATELKNLLVEYFATTDLEPKIQECTRLLKSYNPLIGYEIHSFGFNAKAIQKKADVELLKKQIDDLEENLEKKEEEKIRATELFDLYTKQFNEYVIHGKDWDNSLGFTQPEKAQQGDEKLKILRKSQDATEQQLEEARKYLKQISNGDFDYQNVLRERSKAKREKRTYQFRCAGDRQYCELKLKKTELSVQYGRTRGDLLAKQQELFNQQKLTHYSRLLRDGDKYFVAMIDRDSIDQLERLNEQNIKGESYEIMKYASLTSKAVEKLIFERNALQFDRLNQEFNEAKKIWEKRSYKVKGVQETKAMTDREKKDLKKLVTFLNTAIGELNKKIEDNIFVWKPFEITPDFNDFNEFRKYITKTCYHLTREKISKDTIALWDKEGTIDVYQVYNKDFAVDAYCATTERDLASQGAKKKVGKKNLFTLYWENLFKDTGETIRLNPESKVYLRPAKTENEIDEYNVDKDGSKLRYRQNKMIATFQLMFYPTKDLPFEKLQKKIVDTYKEKSYFLGIDVGENSFATICLIDNNGKVVVENNHPMIMDLSMVNNQGEFVEEKDCLLDGKQYKRKQKLLHIPEKDNKYYALSDHFSEQLKNKPIKNFSQEELTQSLKELQSLAPENLAIVDNKGNKVFDYVYAIEHLRTTNKILYHLQIFNKSEEERQYVEKELIDSTRMRNGYISKAVSVITSLAKKYNAMIVFENLDQKDYKGLTLFSEQQLKEISGKEVRAYAGLSPYQLLQNKVIQKCNYLLQKEGDQVLQSTPRLKKVEDIKLMNEQKGQKDTNWGNVIFVDEQNSSKECPNCGFSTKCLENPTIKDNTIMRTDTRDKSKHKLELSDDLIKDRREAYQSVPESLKDKSAGKKQIKITSLFETRIKKGGLVYGKYLEIVGNDPMICVSCGYDTRDQKWVDEHNLKSCDEIAAYIIAKRGQEYVKSGKNIILPLEKEEIKNEKEENTLSEDEGFSLGGNINWNFGSK